MDFKDFGLSSTNNVDSMKKFVIEIHIVGSERFVKVPVCSFELVPFLDILLRYNSDNLMIIVSFNGD